MVCGNGTSKLDDELLLGIAYFSFDKLNLRVSVRLELVVGGSEDVGTVLLSIKSWLGCDIFLEFLPVFQADADGVGFLSGLVRQIKIGDLIFTDTCECQ